MARRYFLVFKKHIYLLAILVVLIVISSITLGYVSTITSIMAGLMMIVLGLALAIWIIKTPAKVSKDDAIGN